MECCRVTRRSRIFIGLTGCQRTPGIGASHSLLSKAIKSQGWDMEILSNKDRVRSNIGDEGWAINMDGSLGYRGRVVVP